MQVRQGQLHPGKTPPRRPRNTIESDATQRGKQRRHTRIPATIAGAREAARIRELCNRPRGRPEAPLAEEPPVSVTGRGRPERPARTGTKFKGSWPVRGWRAVDQEPVKAGAFMAP